MHTRTAIEIRPTRGVGSLQLRELWHARETLWILAWRDIKVRYKQTLLGAAWSILQPLSMMAVFAVFLGLLAKVPAGHQHYPLLVLSGLVPWTLFVYALTQAAGSLVTNEKLLTKVYFPRLIIPLAAILAGFVDFFLALATLIVVMGIYGQAPTAAVAFLPAFVLFTFALTVGVALWLSALSVTYRDVRYAVLFLTQLLFYASPIAYLSTVVPREYRVLYGLDPVAGVVETFRAMMLGTAVDWGLVAVSVGVSVCLLTSGWAYFRRTERYFADIV